MNAICVATFNELEPAESLRERLQNAGVPAMIRDESKLQRFGFFSRPLASKKVQIDADHFERARQLLAEWDRADGALRDAVRCPQCHSPRVEFPQYTRKFITP